VKKPKRTPPPHQVSVRGDTYERLRQRIGAQPIGPTLDAIIREYLDAQETQS
jgi:hypothetical protein